MRKVIYKIVFILFASIVIIGCSKDDNSVDEIVEEVLKSSAKEILSFEFTVADNSNLNEVVTAVVNETDKTISVVFPFETDITSLVPTIEISEKATINLTGVQDFSNEVSYTVTAEDGSSAIYSTKITVAEPLPFVTTWQTTFANDNVTIYINDSVSDYNYQVDWGDGTVESGFTDDASHDYADAGVYTVSITGDFFAIKQHTSANAEKLLTIESWGDIKWKSMNGAFSFCNNVTYNATDNPNLENVSDMSSMFYDAFAFNGAIGSWDVSAVTNMAYMFYRTTSFNQNLNDWDVSSVTSMRRMFSNATIFNGAIGNWNVSEVVTMERMFANVTSFNQDLNNWEPVKVTDMSGMFYDATSFNGAIGDWDVSKVTTMQNMFYNASSFNQDISGWNVSVLESMGGIFNGATVFSQDLTGWATDNVTSCLFFRARSGLTSEQSPTLSCEVSY